MQNVRNDEAQNWFCLRMFLRSFACAAGLIAVLSPAIAQPSSPNQTPAQIEALMRAEATSTNIHAWLESKDPRLIAWGAYFARENDDTDALGIVAQLVKRSLSQGGPGLLSGGEPQNAALSEVLDALIEKRVLLSAEMLSYVSRTHPIQTIILLSMLPSAERRENLMQWYGGARSDGPQALQRVAAMLLAKSPPPGFAASVLRSSEESLIIHITLPRGGGKIGFGSRVIGGLCADYGPPNPLAGWPELFYYRFHENDRTSADPLLVEAGGDQITWERAPNGRFRSCGEVEGLTQGTRHHLLAEMLGVRDDAMTWPTQRDVTIDRESDDQLNREIGAAVVAEQAILLTSVQHFQSKALITAEEAKTALPKLSVTIKYEDPPR